MIYSEPGTAATPRCVVPGGGLLRGVSSSRDKGGDEYWDHENSAWVRVVLPTASAHAGAEADGADSHLLGWALRQHGDGTVYLRPSPEGRLHIAAPQDCFVDASVHIDPVSGEHAIMTGGSGSAGSASGWGGEPGGSQAEVAEASAALLAQLQGYGGGGGAGYGGGADGAMHLDGVARAASGACTPALSMVWWLCALRHALRLQALARPTGGRGAGGGRERESCEREVARDDDGGGTGGGKGGGKGEEEESELLRLWLRCLAALRPPPPTPKPAAS